jgi:MFS family permease
VYIKPMEAEFGWSRSALSGAAAMSLLFLGAAAPFVGWLADRWGPRLYEWVGNYSLAFLSAAVMAFLASGMAMAIREEPVRARPTPTPAPAVAVA